MHRGGRDTMQPTRARRASSTAAVATPQGSTPPAPDACARRRRVGRSSIAPLVVALLILAPAASSQQLPAAPPSGAPAAPADPLAAARRHLAAGERAAAVALLEPLVAADAPLPPAAARRLLAGAYLDLGRPADAAAVLAPLAAPGVEPADGEALFLAARAALALGRGEQGEELLERAARAAPQSLAAVLLADLRTRQERHQEAADLLAPIVADLDAVAARDEALAARLALHYASTLAALGRGGEALAPVRRATELAPGDPEAWRLLGDLLIEREEIEAARRAFARVQELEQEAHEAEVAAAERRRRVDELVLASAAHHEAGRWEEALAALRQAIALDGTALQPRLLEIRLLLSLQRAAEALARGDELVRLAPDHPDARHLRGMARLAGGDPASAEADFRRALAVAPNHPGAANGLALARAALGR
jgi:cellulose synthase operon protein C